MPQRYWKNLCSMVLVLLLSSCSSIPESIEPVSNFELDRYMGRWYEIARLDHRFERGLEEVTATYSLQDDGTVKVVNRGYRDDDGEWHDATGKARFAGATDVGNLEVSFFGFFYGSYVIFDLDHADYQYAFVTGGESTLWFLSRTPQVSQSLKQRFEQQVADAGYAVDELIYVRQPDEPPGSAAGELSK